MGQVRRHVKASGPPRTTSSTCLRTRVDRRLDGFGRKITAFKAIADDIIDFEIEIDLPLMHYDAIEVFNLNKFNLIIKERERGRRQGMIVNDDFLNNYSQIIHVVLFFFA